jgi:hypothetical protein
MSVWRQLGYPAGSIHDPLAGVELDAPHTPYPSRSTFGRAAGVGQKSERWESNKYRRLVATLPCGMCGREGLSQFAHANSYQLDKSKGKKAPDWAGFPLCAASPGDDGCHIRHDQHQLGLGPEERLVVEHALIVSTYRQLLERNLLLLAKP